MRDCSPGPAASRYAVVALTASTSRNSSAESGPVIAPGTQVRPPSMVRTQVAWCPETHTTLSSTALTACSSAVVWLSCSVMPTPLWSANPASSTNANESLANMSGLRLPELDLVVVRVHDPGKRAVLGRLGSFDDVDTPGTQLLQQLAEVVDPVVDHEGRFAWAKPLAVFLGDMPHGNASILGLVVRPSEDCAAPVFQHEPQVLLVPRRQCRVVACAFEEDAADAGNFRHVSPQEPCCRRMLSRSCLVNAFSWTIFASAR